MLKLQDAVPPEDGIISRSQAPLPDNEVFPMYENPPWLDPTYYKTLMNDQETLVLEGKLLEDLQALMINIPWQQLFKTYTKAKRKLSIFWWSGVNDVA